MKNDGLAVGVYDLLLIIIRNIKTVLLISVVGGLAGFIVSSYWLKPLYASHVSFSIYNTEQIDQKMSSSDIYASQLLLPSSAVIIKSNTVLGNIAQKLGDGTTIRQLREYINIKAVKDTNILEINVVTHNAEKSFKIAEAMISVVPQKVGELMHSGYITVLDLPFPDNRIYDMHPAFIAGVGAFIGLILSCCVVFIIYRTDCRIKDTDDLRKMYSIPILGEIPNYNSVSKSSGYSG